MTFPTINRWENDRAKPSPLVADQKILRLFEDTVSPLHHRIEFLKQQNTARATGGSPVGATGGSPVGATGGSPVGATGGSPQQGRTPKRNRRSIRLQGYDYYRPGAYFITICIQNRECLFGDIVDGKMRLNDAGRIVADEWLKTAEIRDEIELDEWVVMPNHFHGILRITHGRGDRRVAPTTGDRRVAPTGPKPRSVGAVLAGFKSAVTKQINELRETAGTKLWQRNYWEHIVRNEPELNRIREYIHNNPAQWEMDKLHPDHRAWKGDTVDRTVIREPITEYGVETWMA